MTKTKNDFDRTSIRITFRISPYQFNQLMEKLEAFEKQTNFDGLFQTKLTPHEYARIVLYRHLTPNQG